MGLIEQARKDLIQITTNSDEWGTELTFTAADGTTQAVVNGLSTKHNLVVDGDGANVNSRNTHASVMEQVLTAANYPVRNGNGDITFKGHKLAWTDASGVSKTYIIKEWYPDELLGLIVFKLGDFK